MAFLPWWQTVLDLIGAARYRLERVTPTIVRKIEWLKSGVARTLALAVAAVGSVGEDADRFLRGLVDLGRHALGSVDLAELAPQVSRAQVSEIMGRVAAVVAASGACRGRGDPALVGLPDLFT